MSLPSSEGASNYKRKVLLITGVCNGIGKAIVKEFYKLNYNIMINDIHLDKLKKIVEYTLQTSIKNNNDTKIAFFYGDISQPDTSKLLVDETIKKFGGIDVLINNTSNPGISVIGRTASDYIESGTTNYFTLEEYGISDRNLKGAYLCIRELVKHINNERENKLVDQHTKNTKSQKAKNYSIINISSPYESIPYDLINKGIDSQAGIDPFTSSRSGIKTLTKTIALQLADKGIRVNAIAPGIIATEIHKDIQDKQKIDKNKNKIIPFNRMGTTDEIAQIAVFLSTDIASYITGTIIYVDGGLNLIHSNFFLESDLEKD